LGQGVSNAVGMAISEKMMKARYGTDLVNHKIYCMVGDGCLMEGISYEALSIAGHLQLNNLIVLWDNNSVTIDGSTDVARTENMKMRMESIGFDCFEADGNNIESILGVFNSIRNTKRPVFISFKTTIGLGCAKQGTNKCHGSPVKGEELDELKTYFGWNEAPFCVPNNILTMWNDVGSRGQKEYEAWNSRLQVSPKRQEFLDFIEGKLPNNWKNKLADFKKTVWNERPIEATRKSSNRVLEVLTDTIPQLIGGSADLSPSNLTQTSSTKIAITKNDFSGRYIEYGIREHAMAGIMNGIALSGGFIVYSGTFFCFCDYEKPSIRLSSLMRLPVIHVLTHDSIGVGEDGPTHQPVEQLASLRAMPNINVMRPCNLIETIECYETALNETGTPTAMVLSRQNVNFHSVERSENLSQHGMYIFSDCDGVPDVIIIATGTEVDLAVATKAELGKHGKKVRIVSAPCLELFDKQLPEYKKSVLGKDNILKVAIEASCSFGWHKYIGQNGLFFGIPDDTFGISAPANQVYEFFGLTPACIAEKIFRKIT